MRLLDPVSRARATIAPIAASVVLLSACGGHHHLAEYDFARRSLALVYLAPPAPELRTGVYDAAAGANNPVSAVLHAGSAAAREVEGRRARARLDSASSRIDVGAIMSRRTLAQASRFLGTVTTTDAHHADFLLELDVRSSGIDARSQSAAYLFVDATAVLLDARTGREIWSQDVHGYDRLTPYVRGTEQLPTGIITAGALGTVSVQDFQRALQELADYSSDRITDELRAALDDARDRRASR